MVLVETVGVGQSETEVADLADTVVLAIQPGSGDSLQYMKAGIVEVPDVAVVTKADLGLLAERARRDLELALRLSPDAAAWRSRVLTVAAPAGQGIDDLVEAIAAHLEWLSASSQLDRRRQAHGQSWLERAIREEFGRDGLRRAKAIQVLSDQAPASPFRRLAELSEALEQARPTVGRLYGRS